ncbi:MAG: hypothetical protein ACNA8S_14985 [Deferrisomatales bacterium]
MTSFAEIPSPEGMPSCTGGPGEGDFARLKRAVAEAVEALRGEMRFHPGSHDLPVGAAEHREAGDQADVRAVRLLRHPRTLRPLAAALADARSEIWGRLRGPDGALRKRVDQLLTLSSYPGLILQLGDFGWSALGTPPSQAALDASRQPLSRELRRFRRRGTDADAAPARLVEHMGSRLLWRYGELASWLSARGDGERRTPGPLLGNEDLFVRLAPSVYGLRRLWEGWDPNAETPSELLSRKDCHRYVVARHAGEPIGTFPLWSSAMEHRWCLWGEDHLDRTLFESLLAISQPETWPTGEEERARWAERRRRRGHYGLLRPPGSRAGPSPVALSQLLPVAHYAGIAGSVAWVRANRLLSQELLDGRVADVLALLVAVNALDPPEHWQLPHGIGPWLPQLLELLSAEVQGTGGLSWDGPAGTLLLRRAEDAAKGHRGWVHAAQVAWLVRSLRCGPAAKAGPRPAFVSTRQGELALEFR